jgi:electron transport complex protein RnfG
MMSEHKQKTWQLPLILAVVTGLTTGLLMLSHELTADAIAAQQQAKKLASLQRLIPAELVDNDVLADAVTIFEAERLGHRHAESMYLGRQQGDILFWAVPVTARNGYSGDIDLLVGVRKDGSITAVEIISHRETPGLGDLIERRKSDWLQQFPDTSFEAPDESRWKVKKDGGAFDQITAATITPRAVVGAIRQVLRYHAATLSQSGSVLPHE